MPTPYPTPRQMTPPVALATILIVATTAAAAPFRFTHHYGDRHLEGRNMGQTALADLDQDGDLDFITGEQNGTLFWYEFLAADQWTRHPLGEQSPSDVGAEALDVNGDGWIDLVAGGAWYENPRTPRREKFVRHVFDPQLAAVHDLIVGDLNGDGRPDVITMSDQNDVRWYEIPTDPTQPWQAVHIGPSVHSGIALGDLDADGDLDLVRSNVWFENLESGQRWAMHAMTEPWGADYPSFAVNATQTETVDLDRDGRLDVVICDGENPNSKIAWLQAPADPRSGPWTVHHLPRSDDAPRGALHSLKIADFDLDGDPDIFTVEMERFPGARPPRWFIWENVDGRGMLKEQVVLDANLGGHEAVVGDVDGDGDIDICAKPWTPNENNAVGGENHFDFLENLAK